MKIELRPLDDSNKSDCINLAYFKENGETVFELKW